MPTRRTTAPRMLALIAATVACALPAQAQLRGHGGPVRALAISADGGEAISGSFDTSAIRWSLKTDTAEEVLRFHDGAVNAVVFLPDGGVATSGADARIAIWAAGDAQPRQVLQGHTAPVAALALSPDGTMLASASWDRTVRLWPRGGHSASPAPRVFAGHQQNVNGVAFLPDGSALVSASYDATLRIWPRGGGAPIIVSMPAPLNAAAVAPDGAILCAGADGKVYELSPAGALQATIAAADTPIVALAVSPDGARVAAASIRGAVAVIERATRTVTQTLVGPGLPVWSAAFFPDNRTLLTGGADRVIRRWDTTNGEPLGSLAVGRPADPLAAYAGDPGAAVFRACVACHTLKPDEGIRAGPTLAGVFGRRIATLPGYNFSSALKQLDIIWTPQTLAKLFELGPATFTPGTKMPEQTISNPADRAALVEFLQKVTR